MKRKNADGVGDYDDAFSPVPAASGFQTILSLATHSHNLTCSQTTSTSLKHLHKVNSCQVMDNGNVYISAPPGYEEDPLNVYRLVKPLYGMPSAARGNMHGTLP